ncbi:sigma-E factor negative regulatory protein [Variovorax sp. VNK109]|uniref:sigma-E factor negative regulatory protein n=1 Tax=Variovorax sp. VNK109 TaxID=3400919 RepID=UPI003C2F5CBD
MMDKIVDPCERISALADGELRGEMFALAVEQLTDDPRARATWNTYHVVGEVLRTGERAAHGADMAFVERLRVRLGEVDRRAPAALQSVEPVEVSRHEAANSPAWKWVAGFASVAAVAAVGWSVMGTQAPADSGARLALTPVPQVGVVRASVSPEPVQLASGEPPQVMIRDPRLDELLSAHKQAGGASALQMPAGFLRNATFEAPGR